MVSVGDLGSQIGRLKLLGYHEFSCLQLPRIAQIAVGTVYLLQAAFWIMNHKFLNHNVQNRFPIERAPALMLALGTPTHSGEVTLLHPCPLLQTTRGRGADNLGMG